MRIYLLCLVLLAVINFGCDHSGSIKLPEAKLLWQSKGFSDYHMDERLSSFAVDDAWYRITVRSDTVYEVMNLRTGIVIENARFFTVEGLFLYLDQVDSNYLDVSFDPDFGFPDNLNYDNPNWIDEEVTCAISRFKKF